MKRQHGEGAPLFYPGSYTSILQQNFNKNVPQQILGTGKYSSPMYPERERGLVSI